MECLSRMRASIGDSPLAVLVGFTEDTFTALSGSVLTTPPTSPVGRLRAGQQPH